RYAALAGTYPEADPNSTGDYSVLTSCGPFSHLAPGQSLFFAVAFVGIQSPDSALVAVLDTRMLYRGARLNLKPDRSHGSAVVGETGVNGHEICLEPPPGIEFDYDPHCPEKFIFDPDLIPIDPTRLLPTANFQIHYSSGHCVWT